MLVLGRACWGQPNCMRSQTLPRYQHRALTRSCPSSSNCNSTGFVLLSLDSSPFLPLFSIAVCVCASHSSTFCDRGSSSLISLQRFVSFPLRQAETERKKDGGISPNTPSRAIQTAVSQANTTPALAQHRCPSRTQALVRWSGTTYSLVFIDST